MAEDNISKIKGCLDVVDVISGYLKLQKSGVNFKARCPFHNEKTASFYISPERQIWHCFGCSKGGDMFGFIKEIEGVEFLEALKILANKAGIELDHVNFDPGSKNQKTTLYEICELATKFFEKQLFHSNTGKRVLDYLSDRGLKENTIKEFRLGFSPSDWGFLSDFLKSCDYSEKEIIESGVSIKRNEEPGIYDRFRSRIIFPIFDLNNQTVGFTGRIFEDSVGFAKISSDVAKYINTPQTPIYDKSRILYGLNKAKTEIKKTDQCIIVEGNMDTLMSHQAGVKNTVASSGTALTQNHLRLLQRYTNNLGFCFDTDQAGAIATRRGIGLALSQNFNIKVLEINDKKCKDPADFIEKYGSKWSKVVVCAKPVIDFYFDRAKVNYNSSPEDKKSVIVVLAPLIKRLVSRVEKSHWIAQLAFFLRAKEEDVIADLESSKDDLQVYEGSESIQSTATVNPKTNNDISLDLVNEAIISIIIKNPTLFHSDLKDFNQDYLHPYTRDVILKLTNANIEKFDFSGFLSLFDNSRRMNLEFAYIKSQELWKNFRDQDLKTELKNLLKKAREKQVVVKLTNLELDMKQAEALKDRGRVQELILQFSNLAKELSDIQNKF